MPALDLETIPADVRQAGRVLDHGHVSRQQPQHAGAVLVARLEEQLKAQAYAHVPGAGVDALDDGLDQPLPAQADHGRFAGTDAGHQDDVRAV